MWTQESRIIEMKGFKKWKSKSNTIINNAIINTLKMVCSDMCRWIISLFSFKLWDINTNFTRGWRPQQVMVGGVIIQLVQIWDVESSQKWQWSRCHPIWTGKPMMTWRARRFSHQCFSSRVHGFNRVIISLWWRWGHVK